jgi:hypothetical protein
MNLIVKFAGEDLRERFVERLRAGQPDILDLYIPAKTMPHAVLENLDDEQVRIVRESAKDLGKVFTDVQFDPFGPER